jgi:hypothetical protein
VPPPLARIASPAAEAGDRAQHCSWWHLTIEIQSFDFHPMGIRRDLDALELRTGMRKRVTYSHNGGRTPAGNGLWIEKVRETAPESKC